MEIALSLILGYLFGSIPFAYIVARWRRGVDLRYVDVKNVGGGAVIRQVGKRWGIPVIMLDMGKGAAAVLLAKHGFDVSPAFYMLAGFCAILGHNFPPWIKFHGGRAVAPFMGVMMALSPVGMGATFGVLGVTLLLSRQFFTTIALASPFMIIIVWFVERDVALLGFSIGVALFILLRSRGRLHEVKHFTMRGINDAKALLRRKKD